MQKLWILAFVFISHFSLADALPQWITHPVPDSTSHFYSAGSGPSIKDAKANALNQLSMRLIVDVSSETQSFSKLENGKLNQRLNQTSVQQTERLTFVNIKVINSFVNTEESFVLVSVDKQSVFTQLRDEIVKDLLPFTETKLTETGQVLANRLNFDLLYPRYQKYLALLKSYDIDTQFAALPIEKFVNMTDQLIALTSFSIIAPEHDPLGLTALFSDRLSHYGFSQQANQHHLKLTLVGPELVYTEQNGHHAYRARGQVYFTFDERVISTKAIDEFHFNKDKSLAWSALSDNIKRIIAQ